MLAACEMSGRVRDAFAARGWESWSADLLPSETPAKTFTAREAQGARYDVPGVIPAGYHYQGDVLGLFDWRHPVNQARALLSGHLSIDGDIPLWDLVIAFPPCTHLSLAGARYWKEKQQPRYDLVTGEELPSLQEEAAWFFQAMVNAPAAHVAVENPVGIMGRQVNPLYRVPDQVVQPWMFGDALIKKTCLWLKDLPKLEATHWIGDYPDLERVATGGGSHRVDRRVKGRANNTHEDGEGRDRRGIVRSRTPLGFAQAMAGQWGAHVEMKAAA